MAAERITTRRVVVTLGLALGLAGPAAIGCSAAPPHEAPRVQHVDQLATRLAACKLTELATGLGMDPQVSEIWSAFPDVGAYATLVEDPGQLPAIRFAAALMLRSVSAVEFKKVDPRAMAQVFATALQDDLVGYAFPWGALWAWGTGPVAAPGASRGSDAANAPGAAGVISAADESIGLLGEVLVEIGKPAEPALGALLDDATARDSYLGRDRSAVMAKRQYRVKDFAAYYLSKIANLELAWEPDLTRRDEVIEALRRQLPELPLPMVAPRPARVGGLTTTSQIGRGWSQPRAAGTSARSSQCPTPRTAAFAERNIPVGQGRSAGHR